MTLYEATGAANWLNSDNWLSEAPLDEWHGVTIDDSGRVIELNLSENELSGEIPPELGSLSNLQHLFLFRNELSGEIPPELGSLSNLQGLYLTDNELSGEIPPEMGSLANLRLLAIDGNQLSGEIPPELGSLANLKNLYLSDNELSGEIPPELGTLANLETLFLSGNQLSGEIPPELGNLSELVALHLQENQLSGEIPPELGNLDLTWLFLSGNQLSGCNPTLPDNALVIVSSPSAGDEVESGFVVSGCSRTFESNVQWRLLGRSGAVLSSGFTSGGGVDGPAAFQFSVEFEDVERQIALLEVFDDDVSEGEGFPPPRAIVPIIIGFYQWG